MGAESLTLVRSRVLCSSRLIISILSLKVQLEPVNCPRLGRHHRPSETARQEAIVFVFNNFTDTRRLEIQALPTITSIHAHKGAVYKKQSPYDISKYTSMSRLQCKDAGWNWAISRHQLLSLLALTAAAVLVGLLCLFTIPPPEIRGTPATARPPKVLEESGIFRITGDRQHGAVQPVHANLEQRHALALITTLTSSGGAVVLC